MKKNPLGKAPVLETADGIIFESNAICRFLARNANSLYGSGLY
jgi:glutathione S-transferase